MSKINLNFKGKNYSIDRSLLAGAISDLEAHFGNIGTSTPSTPVNPTPEGNAAVLDEAILDYSILE